MINQHKIKKKFAETKSNKIKKSIWQSDENYNDYVKVIELLCDKINNLSNLDGSEVGNYLDIHRMLQ